MRKILLALAALSLTGCAMTPRPARTEVTPGESEVRSEREERRPSESTMRIRASIPKPEIERPSNPSVRVKVTLPPQP